MPDSPPDDTALTRPVRVVLDTNCSLALFFWDDPRCMSLRLRIASGQEQPILDLACLQEWHRVLAALSADRPKEASAQAGARYAQHLTLIEAAPVIALPRCRDPDDQKFLALAAGVGAASLYTRDHDLLRLQGTARRRLGLRIARPDAHA